MSHELRTPLNSILGFAQLLDMDAPSAQKSQIGHILRAGQHLLTLINEVLDIAKIEAGRLPLNVESVPLVVVLQEALTLVSPMAADAGIRLVELPALAADSGIVADRQRLVQVLLNLLSNAIKYNRPQGQVHIDVKVHQQRIAVSVNDTGKGIAADRLEQLFKPFERLETDPNVEGTGLGLALSKSLLEMMNGTLTVQSKPGEGASFTLELPDLVILDLHMPEFDGFAVLEQLNRRIPTGEYLPILVLTADATRDTRLRALALGAKDFISKPLDALETMLRIWNLLETRALYKTLRTLVPADQIDLLRQRVENHTSG